MRKLLFFILFGTFLSFGLKAQFAWERDLSVSYITGGYEAAGLAGDGFGIKSTLRTFRRKPRWQTEKNLIVASHKNGMASGVTIQDFTAVVVQYVINYDFVCNRIINLGLYAGPAVNFVGGKNSRLNLSGNIDRTEFKRFYGAVAFGLKVRTGIPEKKWGLELALFNAQFGNEGFIDLNVQTGLWMRL